MCNLLLASQPLHRYCQPSMTFFSGAYRADIALTFYDPRKVFDSVPHLPLLQKLKDIGLEQHVLQWLTSYQSDRQQHIVVHGATSTASPGLSGVAQGQV